MSSGVKWLTESQRDALDLAECPFCGATFGNWCIVTRGPNRGSLAANMHDDRYAVAQNRHYVRGKWPARSDRLRT